MKRLKSIALSVFFALGLMATPALAGSITNSGIHNFKKHRIHTYVRQEGYRYIPRSSDGRRYERAWIVWERRDGSRYKRDTWCQLDAPKRCGAKDSIVELRGPRGTVTEPTPADREVTPVPLKSNHRYISQRNYRRQGGFESAWVKFAKRNGDIYEVYTSCRVGTDSCQTGKVRDLGYDRRYDRRSGRGSGSSIDWDSLTKSQKECLAVFGIFGAIADDDKVTDLAALCLLAD